MIGIPYMGSKRKLSKKIIDLIIENNPHAAHFYDLFGGGGAMSFQALKRRRFKSVHYNELNTGVVELLKKIRTDGVTDEFYEWIDREKFHELKNEPTWKGGLVATCWSFGNNSKNYLFSKENEAIKKPLHNIIVNRCEDSINEFYELSGLLVEPHLLRKDKIQDRRLDVMNFIKKNSSDRIGLQQLQQLERLQQLEQLERLQQLQQLEITNLSYEDVEIKTPIESTIIYLDPPYFNTAKYQEIICHDTLYDWITNSPYKIYISSYDMPFEVVAELEHRSTLSATANNKVVEKLFCNQKEKHLGRLF